MLKTYNAPLRVLRAFSLGIPQKGTLGIVHEEFKTLLDCIFWAGCWNLYTRATLSTLSSLATQEQHVELGKFRKTFGPNFYY